MAKKEYTFEELSRDIVQKKFSPVYFFMGEEPFFMDKLTDLLINNVLSEEEKDFNQLVFYGADAEAGAIINAARRFPMMSKYQLIVVREAQLIKDIEELNHYVQNPLQSTVLVVNYKYKNLDRRRALAGSVDKTGILFESKKVADYKMPAFIGSMLQQQNIAIDAKASQMLADFLGNDLSRLTKELDKLSLLLPGNLPKKITPELVEQNIGISKEFNNFELIKALASKDKLKVNRNIHYFGKNPKNNPLQATLPVLFNYFSNLLICYYSKDRSENGLMQALGLKNSFQVKDYAMGIKNYSAMKVFNLISDIRTCDAKSKGVENISFSDGELLKELVYKILH